MTEDARFRREGWAWGSTYGDAPEAHNWLTVAGSALYDARLAETPEDATPPVPIIGEPQILARVRRHGTWFRILEIAPAEQQHHLITARDDKYAHLVTGWCACSTWEWDGRRSVYATGWRFCGSAHPEVVAALFERHHKPVPATVTT